MNRLLTLIAGVAIAGSASAAALPVPVNPEVDSYSRRGFMYELKVDIIPESTDGKPLDTDKVYYRFYIDGEPFTFQKPDYQYVGDGITLIPWDYQDADGVGSDIIKWWGGSDGLRRIFFYQNYSTIGIETVYIDNEEESVSAMLTYNTATGDSEVGDIPVPEPDPTPIITELPEGAEESLHLLDTWMLSGYGIQHYTWSGKYDYLATDGDDVYFKDICGMYRFGTYVKATLMEEGTVLRMDMEQHIFHQDDDPDYGYERADVYLYALRLNEDGDDVEILFDQKYVDFTVTEDGTITLPENLGLAYVGHDGHVLAKNLGYRFEPFDIEEATVTLPEGLGAMPYKLSYASEPGGKRSTKAGINLASDNETNTVYVQGLAKTMTEGWIKGTLEGDKVVFQSRQFVGTYVNDNKDEFAVFFNGAEATDEMDLFGRVYKTLPSITFDYDKRAQTLTTDQCVTETIGDVNPLSHMVEPALEPSEPKEYLPATPANSTVESFRQYGFVYELVVYVPSVDTDGELLDVDGLSYRLYLDDMEVPFVLDMETYQYIESEMVEIPWDYQDQGGVGYDILKWTDEDTRRIFLYSEPKYVGIESIYTVKGETRTSQRYYYTIATGEGGYEDPTKVDAVQAAAADGEVEWLTLDGRRLERPEGLCLKSVRRADGTKKTSKTLIR